MAEIIDLEMSDEEYLQLVAQGRDPVSEKLYQRQLLKLCRSLEDADQMLPRWGHAREATEKTFVSPEACERLYNYLARQPRRSSFPSASGHV